MTASGIHPSAVETFTAQERERFLANNPNSVALAERARKSLYGGVPMHWMADWSTPVPLFVERAKGARFYDVDGHEYMDFCLGDTGTMFGHSPAPIAKALTEQASNGLTTMLPARMRSCAASCWPNASACRIGRSPPRQPMPIATCCAGRVP